MNLKNGLVGLLLAVNLNAGEFSFLDKYDPIVDKTCAYFQARLGKAPDKKLVKAMIAVESGGNSEAFAHDPMQIANEEDCALRSLANGYENTSLIGDFSSLKGYKNTPHKNGKWDYSESNMTPEASIFGGIGWLMNNAANYGYTNIISGPTNSYQIKKGDNYSNLAKSLGTTVKILTQMNPGVNPNNLRIGQRISYAPASIALCIKSWKSWDSAVEAYNGGGDKNYLSKVKKIKDKLGR